MRFSRILASLGTVAVLSSQAGAQTVTLNFDDLAQCNGPLGTYGGWIAIASGGCRSGALFNYATPYSPLNYLLATDANTTIDWSFLNGPVVFNGLYASGWGTYSLSLYSGGNLVSSSTFYSQGGNLLVGANQYGGGIDRVRLNRISGVAALGVDDIMFSPVVTTQETPIDILVNEPNSAPEPATMLLVASGLSGVGAMMRRRRKAKQA